MKKVTFRISALMLAGGLMASAAELGDLADLAKDASTPAGFTIYRLAPNDVLEVKVYQEDDLTTRLRIAKDGTATFPLLGSILLGGKTVDEATGLIREALGKDFLVNPQVTLTVAEYAKRRFTVLGQVQKPGSYEIPNEESVSFLQAIGMAGGYTRLADSGKVNVSRVVNGRKVSHRVDGKSATLDSDGRPFEVQPDDTLTVGERFF